MLHLLQKTYAAAPGTVPNFPNFNFATGDLEAIIKNILGWVLVLAAMIAVIYLVYGGILYITAGGDAEKATKGRTALINAIIGIIIIVLAFTILQFVAKILR